jgi:hypothetical protein
MRLKRNLPSPPSAHVVKPWQYYRLVVASSHLRVGLAASSRRTRARSLSGEGRATLSLQTCAWGLGSAAEWVPTLRAHLKLDTYQPPVRARRRDIRDLTKVLESGC